MRERTAVALVFVGTLLLLVVLMVGPALLGAGERLIAMLALIPLILGSWAVSEVTMHYGRKRRGHRD
jgi:hypothetical protein